MEIPKMIQMGAAAFLLSGVAMADAVDLSSWSDTSGGNWTVQGTGNDSVYQSVNGTPTIFHNNLDSQGLALSGEITVQTTSDDDFIGFVLGYNTGDLTNASADYMLIDWKQGNQTAYSAYGAAGLAISHVEGVLGTTDAWGHSGNVTQIARANNLGSTGWIDNQTYSFDLIFTESLIKVFVDGVEELSILAQTLGLESFNNGSFGFYNFSQGSVLYAGIEENIAPPAVVPVPAAAFLFAPALLGFMGLRRKAKNSVA